jgi:hypothetical protein
MDFTKIEDPCAFLVWLFGSESAGWPKPDLCAKSGQVRLDRGNTYNEASLALHQDS